MMRGQFENSKKGTYYVHVTTKDGKPVKEDTLYALQVQLGDKFTNDYVTQEQSIDHTDMTKADMALAQAQDAIQSATANGSVLAAQGAADLLATGYTNMAVLQQNTGKSAAAKIFSILT